MDQWTLSPRRFEACTPPGGIETPGGQRNERIEKNASYDRISHERDQETAKDEDCRIRPLISRRASRCFHEEMIADKQSGYQTELEIQQGLVLAAHDLGIGVRSRVLNE